MARLVAATCPKCGASVRLDPAVQFVTCTYCGTSSFIETKSRPPTEQVIQAHYPVIRVQAASALWVAIPIALGVLGIAASAAFAVVPALLATNGLSAVNVAVTRPSPVGVQTPAPVRSAAPIVKVNLFADATSLRPGLEQALGKPLKLKEIVLYDEYAIVTAQDPKNAAHIDRYTYRRGELGTPDPQRVSASDLKSIEKTLFDLAEIDFALVPVMAADAQRAIPLEAGKVSHAILSRSSSFGKDATWRVYVTGPRDSGYVVYSTKGQRKRVVN